MRGFADLADLPEDERIRIIADTARCGHSIAVFVDDDAAADRYVKKLEAAGGVSILFRGPAPTPIPSPTVFLKVGPKGH